MSADPPRQQRSLTLVALLLVAAAIAFPASANNRDVAPAGVPVSDFTFYNADALANGITVGLDIKNLLPLKQLLQLSSATAQARLSVGLSTSLAVLPDPGELVLSLPGTAAGLLGVSGLPDYPAAARADYPVTPSAEVDLVPDAGLGAGRFRADAAETSSSASAFLAGFNKPVGVLPFTVGGVRSDSTITHDTESSFSVTSKSTVTDLNVLGGLLHIGSVTSEATVRYSGGVLRADPPKTEVTGAIAAGSAVGITDAGIVAPGTATAIAPIIDAAAASLKGLGVSVHTTPVSVAESDGHAASSSGQLRIDFETVVDNLPTIVSIGFGQAISSLDLTAPVLDEAGAFVPPVATGTDGTPAIDTGSPVASGSEVVPPLSTSPAPTKSRSSASGSVDRSVPLTTVLDFRPLYRSLALMGAALLLARTVMLALARRRQLARSDVRALRRW